MSDSRLDKGLGKTSLTLVWNKMKAYVNSFMGTIDAKLNALSVDYIVEQGTSDIWTYRKWNSGIAECWGKYVTTSTSVAGTGLSHCGSAFPFTFSEAPVVTANFGLNAQPAACIRYVSSKTTNVDLYGDNAGQNNGTTCWFHIYVKGRWK